MVERTLNIKHISTIINLHQSHSNSLNSSNVIVMYGNSKMEHHVYYFLGIIIIIIIITIIDREFVTSAKKIREF